MFFLLHATQLPFSTSLAASFSSSSSSSPGAFVVCPLSSALFSPPFWAHSSLSGPRGPRLRGKRGQGREGDKRRGMLLLETNSNLRALSLSLSLGQPHASRLGPTFLPCIPPFFSLFGYIMVLASPRGKKRPRESSKLAAKRVFFFRVGSSFAAAEPSEREALQLLLLFPPPFTLRSSLFCPRRPSGPENTL